MSSVYHLHLFMASPCSQTYFPFHVLCGQAHRILCCSLANSTRIECWFKQNQSAAALIRTPSTPRSCELSKLVSVYGLYWKLPVERASIVSPFAAVPVGPSLLCVISMAWISIAGSILEFPLVSRWPPISHCSPGIELKIPRILAVWT